MASVSLIGTTGLVGSNILSTLISLPNIQAIHAISRRSPPNISDAAAHPQLQLHLSESDQWVSTMGTLSPPPTILFSGLGTTRATAGGLANQYKIDHDLNLEVARAAHASGTKIYVLISSASANSTSRIPYTKMKGELEDHVRALGFEKVIIIRPGMIVGNRGTARRMESMISSMANAMGNYLGNGIKDFWAQDAEVIARAGVLAGFRASEGKTAEDLGMKEGAKGEWILEAREIVRLGRTEWPAFEQLRAPVAA